MSSITGGNALNPQLDGIPLLVRSLQVLEVVLELLVALLVRFDLVRDPLVGGGHVGSRLLGPADAQRGDDVPVVERHLERLVVGGLKLQ